MDNLQRRQKLAWDLYRDYIAVGAKHELNLDSMSRKVTTLAMITPHLTTFDTARGRIMNLLSNDAYIRFLSWEIYKELAAQTPPTPNIPPRSSTKTSIISPTTPPPPFEDLALARLDRPTSLTRPLSVSTASKADATAAAAAMAATTTRPKSQLNPLSADGGSARSRTGKDIPLREFT